MADQQTAETVKEYAWQGRRFSQEVLTATDEGVRTQGIIVEPVAVTRTVRLNGDDFDIGN